MDSEPAVSEILERIREGDGEARESLFVIMTDELRLTARRMMRRERSDHTLDASALINEAMLRVIQGGAVEASNNRRFLFHAAVQAMRRILIDHARARAASRRLGEAKRTMMDVILDTMEQRDQTNVIEVSEALDRLREQSPRQADALEARYFSQMSIEEIAQHLEISPATVKRDLQVATAKMAVLMGR
ncbi:MAG: ECF-type sigma factor [Planctomycetota bacterium]